MCLYQRKDVGIPEANGWKVFSINEQGQLQSTFNNAFYKYQDAIKDRYPVYPANEKIRVIPEESSFFAFREFNHACNIANEARQWNVKNHKLIVLPVTQYEIVAEGNLWAPSNDAQVLDGYYPAYESKEILVHDSLEIRQECFMKVVLTKLERDQYRLSYLEKQAFEHLVNLKRIA